MTHLFEKYRWVNRSGVTGHRELFDLERKITAAAMTNSFTRSNLEDIAEWGNLPDVKKIQSPDPFRIPLYSGNKPALCHYYDPVNAICIIESRVKGFGPTFSSKLLHFSIPQIYGALDTRLVRVFGNDSKDPESYHFLNLKVNRPKKGRPSIPKTQTNWPEEYGTWLGILRYMADHLNTEGIHCPHLEIYYSKNMRERKIWLPADVETALFCYASRIVKGDNSIA